ncbi:MAG: serine/threonine protein kinase/WD40 repeat protein, partial [Planctomycetota bacterium]
EREFLSPGPAPSPEGSIPERIGRYRVLRSIGRGGMGVVYEAVQDSPHRSVALKVLHPELLSESGLRRFGLEAEVLGRLQHQGIAQVFDARTTIEDDKTPYLAMELIQGPPITTWARTAALGAEGCLDLVARVCDAIEHAHQQGVIHRDLKPGNILVDSTGQPKILDFGIARMVDDGDPGTLLTLTGQVIGTAAYMSPEQAQGEADKIDARCDVYALGVIAYELLAGNLPHDITQLSLHEAILKIVSEEPTPLGELRDELRGDAATIVHKAMDKDRTRRYSSAADFAQDIRRFLRHEPIQARPATALYQVKKFARRHRILVAGIAATTVAIAIGIFSTLAFESDARQGRIDTRQAMSRTRIASALSSLDRHDLSSARAAFEAITDPVEQGTWEYGYLNARMNPAVSRYSFQASPGEVHEGPARSGTSADGAPLILDVADGALIVVDLDRMETIASHPCDRQVEQATLSPDGSLIAALTDAGRELTIWDNSTNQERLRLPLEGQAIEQLRFSEDNSVLAMVSTSEVTALDPRTGLRLWRTFLPQDVELDQVISASWSRSTPGRLALLCANSQPFSPVIVLDQAGKLVHSRLHTANRLAISPDGLTLAFSTGETERVVFLISVETMDVLGELPGHFDGVMGLAFSSDGSRLATATRELVRVWDMSKYTPIASFPATAGPDSSLSLHGDKLVIANASSAQVFEADSPSSVVLRNHPSFVYMVAISADGSTIASRDYSQGAMLWDSATGELLADWPLEGIAKGLGFTSKGMLITNGPDLVVLDPATGDVVLEQLWGPEDYHVHALGGSKDIAHSFKGESRATSPDGTLLVEGNLGGVLIVKDRASGAILHELSAHDGPVFAVAVSHDNRYLATGGEDRRICLWDLETGRRISSRDHASPAYTLQFSPDGRRLASGGNSESIQLWDVPSLEVVARLVGHTSYVHSVAFSPDGSFLVSASGDSDLRIWDTIPRSERLLSAAADRDLLAEMRPVVEAMYSQHGNLADVAAQIRVDEELSPEQRRAALRALMQLGPRK